ncbi:hypothetical protein BH20ACT6_BH20ACT6_11320 [soil metagenome]
MRVKLSHPRSLPRLARLGATAVLAVALTGLAGCGDDGAGVRELEPGCAESGSGSGSGSGSESGSGGGSASEECPSEGSSSQ